MPPNSFYLTPARGHVKSGRWVYGCITYVRQMIEKVFLFLFGRYCLKFDFPRAEFGHSHLRLATGTCGAAVTAATVPGCTLFERRIIRKKEIFKKSHFSGFKGYRALGIEYFSWFPLPRRLQ